MARRTWVVPIAVGLMLAGCGELPTEGDEADLENAEVRAEVAEAEPPTDEAFPERSGSSTVCTAYGNRLFELRRHLSEDPDDEVLRDRETTFAALVELAC